MVPHQASAVAIGGRAVLIEGPPGSGKSSLALALIDRGAVLIGDDSLLLEWRGDGGARQLLAHPHPNTRGLIEVRNLGLLPFPMAEGVPVALLLWLDPAAPRYIDQAECAHICGGIVPLVRLWPESPVQALKAELALARYGLPVS